MGKSGVAVCRYNVNHLGLNVSTMTVKIALVRMGVSRPILTTDEHRSAIELLTRASD